MKTTAGKIAAAYKASQVNLAGLVKDVGNKILLLFFDFFLFAAALICVASTF